MRTKFIFLLLWTVLSCGCFWFTSREDGDMLKEQTVKLEKQVKELEQARDKDSERYTEMITSAEKQVKELEKVLKEATEVLTRNSADFGADMEQIKENLRQIEGALAEISHAVEEEQKARAEAEASHSRRLEEVARQSGIEVVIDPATIPTDKKEHFERIEAAYKAGRYGEARTLAKIFIEKYPKDSYADDARMVIARSYYKQKKYSSSLGALQKTVDDYPKSSHMSEVLYLMGSCFHSLGSCSDARTLYDSVVAKYPRSSWAKKAKTGIKNIKSNSSQCR